MFWNISSSSSSLFLLALSDRWLALGSVWNSKVVSRKLFELKNIQSQNLKSKFRSKNGQQFWNLYPGSLSSLLLLAHSDRWLPLGSVWNSKVVSRKYSKSKIFKLKIWTQNSGVKMVNSFEIYIQVLRRSWFCWLFLVAACPLEAFGIRKLCWENIRSPKYSKSKFELQIPE